jgi:hypothetical protein|tara:strand:- start:2147 stop:2350 length:204 start_codon:yes stop_codon:yes gene_type:complete
MDTFSIYWTDLSGTQHTEMKYKPMDDIKPALGRLLRGPGRAVVKELIVVDALDCTVLKAVDGKLVFP